jgi:hypothetical protein
MRKRTIAGPVIRDRLAAVEPNHPSEVTRLALALALALLLLPASRLAAQCDTFVPALKTGHYDTNGFHNAADPSYVAGNVTNAGGPFRNFAVFQLPVFQGALQSASLIVRAGGAHTTDSNGLFTLFTVTNPPLTVAAGQTNARWIYDDLGNGTVAGTFVFHTNYSPYEFVGMGLGTDVLPLLNAAAATPGRHFALGGMVTDLQGNPGDIGWVFDHGAAGPSNHIYLALHVAPAITYMSADRSVWAGEWAWFYAEGCADSWQWYHNGQPIPGETGTQLFFQTTGTNDAGTYYIVGESGGIRATGQVATLSVVTTPPAFIDQPQSQTLLHGDWMWLYAHAQSYPEPVFQWYRNGVSIPGANMFYYYVQGVTVADAGNYQLVATNHYGAATSSVASITVSHLIFDSLSAAPSAMQGSSWQVAAYYRASAPMNFHWSFNGAPVPGATNSYLVLSNVQTNQAGSYQVIISNSFAAVTSTVAVLEVVRAAPVLTSTLYDQSAYVGNNLYLSSYASAGPPAQYQWYFNSQPLSGATNYYLNLLNLQTNHSGLYHVVAFNELGAATSRVATISAVYAPPYAYLTSYPNSPVVAGGTIFLLGYGWGAPPPDFQWLHDGQAVPGATNAALMVLNAGTNDSGLYSLRVSNLAGVATSGVVQVTVRAARPLDRWSWRNPHPQGNPIYAAASSDTTCVAIGDGTIISSTNGLDWHVRSITGFYFHKIAFGNGRFVALAYYSAANYFPSPPVVFASTNGLDWETSVPAGLTQGASVSFADGRFFLAGTFGNAGGGHSISLDGITWSPPIVSPIANVSGIASGQSGELVTIGGYWAYRSTDGTNWAFSANLPTYASLLLHGAGQYAAFGYSYVMLSPDGTNWQFQSLPGYAPAQAFGSFSNHLFAAVNGQEIVRSSNGVVWTNMATFTNAPVTAFGNFQNAIYAFGSGGVVARSADGVTWQPVHTRHGSDLNGLARGAGIYVAVGNGGTILVSTNAADWSPVPSGTTVTLRDVVFADGRFVAVGRNGTILTSFDGLSWNMSSNSPNYLEHICHAAGLWVVVGEFSTILTSPDAMTWTQRPAPASLPAWSDFEGVTFGNGRFVIVGGYFDNNASSFILTSTNGIHWDYLWYDWGVRLRGVGFVNGRFIGVGNDGLVVRSTDAFNWTATWLPTTNLRYVTHGAGRYLVVGNDNRVFSSADTFSWTAHPLPTTANLHSVLHTDNTFLTVGNDGTILQSAPLLPRIHPALRHGPHGLILQLSGTGDGGCTLQCSTNLINWVDVTGFDGGVAPVTVTNNPGAPLQFYRIISPQAAP